MENNKTRLRAPNFTNAECMHLCTILEKYKDILENKKTDGVSLQGKQTAWINVCNEYNSTTNSYSRTVSSLMQCYKNIKKKTKRQLSASKMSIPVDRNKLVESVEEHGFQWLKISEEVGVPAEDCQAEFDNLQNQSKKQTKDIKDNLLRTGGGPSTSHDDPLLERVKNLVGPSLEGLYTIYDGDSTLMETQGVIPIEATHTDEAQSLSVDMETPKPDPNFFTNDRRNLKRKPHCKLSVSKSKNNKKETVADTFKTLASLKMELVTLQKDLIKKQIEVEDEKLRTAQIERMHAEKKFEHQKKIWEIELKKTNIS